VIPRIRRKPLRESRHVGLLLPHRLTFARHKRRVTEHLLSHAVSCGLPTVKLFLVALLEHVPDRAKAEALSPIVQALMDKVKVAEWERLFGPQFEEFATITVSAFDASAAAILNDPAGIIWPVFLNAIEFYFRPGEYRVSIALVVLVLISTCPRFSSFAKGGALQQLKERLILSPVSRSPEGALPVYYYDWCGVV
jgi:hypothetical protein